MAKIQLGPLVSKISGKLGDLVFSQGKTNSPYVKMRQTKTTNPSSANQASQRCIFATLSKAWEQLSITNQGIWNTYAANGYGKRIIPTGGGARSIIHGNTGRGGGKGLFMYVNQNRFRTGGSTLGVPKVGAVIPDPFSTFTATCTGGTVTVTGGGAASANCGQIWVVGTGKIPHRQVAVDSIISGPITFSNVNGAKGTPMALTAIVGTDIYVQGEVIDPTSGLASNPSDTVKVKVA
jgi:hypothetical protein